MTGHCVWSTSSTRARPLEGSRARPSYSALPVSSAFLRSPISSFRGLAGQLTWSGYRSASGGAAANLIDRVRSGEVIDSLKVAYWPAFNFADVAITVGIALLLWEQLVARDSVEPPRTEATDTEARGHDG